MKTETTLTNEQREIILKALRIGWQQLSVAYEAVPYGDDNNLARSILAIEQAIDEIQPFANRYYLSMSLDAGRTWIPMIEAQTTLSDWNFIWGVERFPTEDAARKAATEYEPIAGAVMCIVYTNGCGTQYIEI